MRELVVELLYFAKVNAKASAFGAFLMVTFFITLVLDVPFVSRYDFIFLMAVFYQVCALVFKFERPREFIVILVFHLLATGMELFKTNPAIGSWMYPEVGTAKFAIATVPLFTGFLYSAVGSYISRAITFMKLSYTKFPSHHHMWIVAVLIYVNFFTHHFTYDIRDLLFVYILVIFWKTNVSFIVYKKVRNMPFILTGFLTALFIWIAENVGSVTKVWLYPNQIDYWRIVSFGKIGSWFLLLILSFAIVSIIYRDKLQR